MKNLIASIKANPISVVSAIVVLLSVGFLVWVHLQGNALKKEVASGKQTISKIKGFNKDSIELPPENPNDPPVLSPSFTPNQPEIDLVKALNARMDQEYNGIFRYAVERNRAGKQTLAEGLFPDWGENVHIPFTARDNFFDAFDAMFGAASADQPGVPRLDAGMPPTPDRLALALSEARQGVEASQFGQRTLTVEQQQRQQEELAEVEQQRLLELLADRAMAIHIYADANYANYPFDIDALSMEIDPTAHQLWEAQMELWIQQDIVAAIADANEVTNSETNVLTAPVKRLISIEVIPGYIGFHTRGGLFNEAAQLGQTGMYPPPMAGMTGSADEPQSDNFYVGPTGRVSNALYDVRQVRLNVIVDFQQLPKLFESIRRTNFMTVVDVMVEDEDEYLALQEGFFYGPADVVHASLLIETIWLRQWTVPFMPDKTKQYVGLMEPEQASEFGPGMGGFGPMGGMGPGGPTGMR